MHACSRVNTSAGGQTHACTRRETPVKHPLPTPDCAVRTMSPKMFHLLSQFHRLLSTETLSKKKTQSSKTGLNKFDVSTNLIIKVF